MKPDRINLQKQKWNRFAQILVILSAVLMLTVGMGITANAASLSKNKLTVYQGQSFRLRLKGVSGKVRWSSTKPWIAKVDSKGVVQTLKPGICRIKASSGGKAYSCRLKVKGLKFVNLSPVMVRGRRQALQFNYEKVMGAVWSSSDPDVAVVQDGVVTSKKPGRTVIQAVWNEVSVTCEITVKDIRPEHLTQAYVPNKANRGKIVLAGSSSIDYWLDAPFAFAPYEVINTAIGGTQVTHWLSWYPALITQYKPSAVVLYVGSNDLSNGELISGEENAKNTILLLDKISARLKSIPVFYVSINPCWFRKGAWEKIAVSNQIVQNYCSSRNYLYYIDIVTASMDSNGTPDSGYFQKDMLHPNERGYALWERLVARQVKLTMNRLQKEAQKKTKNQKKAKKKKK